MLQLLSRVYTENNCWIYLADNMYRKHLRVTQQDRHIRTMTLPQKFLFFHDEMSTFEKICKIVWVFGVLDAHYSKILEYAIKRQRKKEKNSNLVKSSTRKIRKKY